MVDLACSWDMQKHTFILMFIFCSPLLALKKEDCEVCFGVLEKFDKSLHPDKRGSHVVIEDEFKIFCKERDAKESRFCYYVGAHVESPTGILGEISKRVSSSLPPAKICERLKKLDSQICELRYEKMIDFKTVDLKKLKVRELKKILTSWDEICDGCIEKTDYISRIEELKPIYVKDEL